jgi:Glycosyltransferase family 87
VGASPSQAGRTTASRDQAGAAAVAGVPGVVPVLPSRCATMVNMAAPVPKRVRAVRFLVLLLPILYGEYTIWSVQNRGLFEYVGIDHRVLRSTAEIAWHEGFAAVYQFSSQALRQRDLFRAFAGPVAMRSGALPFPYLPAFIPPVLVVLPFAPAAGFLVWTILNAAGMALYTRRFLGGFGIKRRSGLIFAAMSSAPVFFTLLFGQFTLPLIIGFGEFLLAIRHGRPFASGLWLAGLALKPQTLVLLGPALVVGRQYRAMAGAVAGGLALVGVSFLLAGPLGMERLAETYRDVGRLPGTFPQSMMNWRALAVNLIGEPLSAPGYGLAIAGMAVTTFFALRPYRTSVGAADILMVGLLMWAATGAVSWHAHVHMAAPLLLPLAALAARHDWAWWLFGAWVVLPGVLFVETAFLLDPGAAHQILGLCLFAFNLLCVLAAALALRGTRAGALRAGAHVG